MLNWSIKPSLLAYAAQLEDVSLDFSNGAEGSLAEGFHFPILEAEGLENGEDGSIRATGTVILRGHGTIICEISDPHIDVTEEQGVLSVRRWPNRSARLVVGTFNFNLHETCDVGWRWQDVTLAASGREVFDFHYEEGAELAALEVTLH